MKKSLLALGATAALGGLGFSGAAHALWAVQPADTAEATTLSVATDTGVGHILVTPYFSTSAQNGTLLSVVNTDTQNGKAVKVRFRGAANSDDVLDFTVLLSPYDVWTASVSQGEDGYSVLTSPDSSCVLPSRPTNGVKFRDFRLDQTLSAEAKAAHTQEGYVEWLNMADIAEGSALFKTIKHSNNVAECNTDLMDALMAPTTIYSEGQASAFGLVPPTGGLMGNWSIYNNQNVTSYGGSSTAIVALNDAVDPPVPAAGRLFFAPQIGTQVSTLTVPNTIDGGFGETADPLLANAAAGGDQIIDLLAFDLPDLSTPYVSGHATAPEQSTALSAAIAATSVMNEWTAGSSDGVDFSTDWVFSQPTRRYHAAVDYTNKVGNVVTPVAVYNSLSSPFYYPSTSMTEKVSGVDGMYGTVLCLADGQVTYRAYNREETYTRATFEGDWSPGLPPDVQPGFCGEVATLTFGSTESKALNAKLTTFEVQGLPDGGAGWMSAATPGQDGFGLPVIGFAANTFSAANGSNVGNYGDAITHRYVRPTVPAPVITPDEGGF